MVEKERIYRRAVPADMRAIYDIQNVSFRMEVFDLPLPSFDQFCKEKETARELGEEHYFLLEEDGVLLGFTWFTKSPNFWFSTIWGKWLKTLTYASCIAGFDYLYFDRSVLGVRQSNRRMIRILDEFGFRLVGETPILYAAPDPPVLRTAILNYYDIKREEFWENREKWKRKSLEFTVKID